MDAFPPQVATVEPDGGVLVGDDGSECAAEAVRVAALAEFEPQLAEPLAPGVDVTAAEVVWAVRHEGGMDVDDVLDRRTRIGLVEADRAAALPAARELVTKALAGVTV